MVDCYVPVGIIMPAHNENVTVESPVRSLLTLDYSLYEIVVVDDGSTDDTAQVVIDAFSCAPSTAPSVCRSPASRSKACGSGACRAFPSR